MTIRPTPMLAAIAALALTVTGCAGSSSTSAGGEGKPSGDITMIVPFAAGGGSDVAGRTIGKAIEAAQPDLTVTVENREGGSGAVGYAYFQGQAGNAETLLATETSLLALPASGDVQWTYEDFTPIMKVAEDFTLLVVPSDSPYETCPDVVDAARQGRVIAGISGQYGLDNVVFSLVEEQTGTEFDRVAFESGGELIAALLGGQIDIASLNPGEVIGQLEAGELKALCAFSEKRYTYGELQDIPTAKEQGLDVSFAQFRGILAPGEITDSQRSYWIKTMKEVLETPEYKRYIKQNYLQPSTAAGDQFEAYLEQNKKVLQKALEQ